MAAGAFFPSHFLPKSLKLLKNPLCVAAGAFFPAIFVQNPSKSSNLMQNIDFDIKNKTKACLGGGGGGGSGGFFEEAKTQRKKTIS